MSGKITHIEIFKSKIALRKPFIISLGPFYYAENVIVRIHTTDGITGTGESSPFPTIHGETADTALIAGNYLSRVLTGLDSADIPQCIKKMDEVIFGNSSIKSAFDIALYDIQSQSAGLPLFAYLGGRNSKKLYTDYTVSLGTPEQMAADALKLKNDGFPVIKVKLGEGQIADIQRIQSIRSAIGAELPLRIDANQGWTYLEAIEILTQLADYNIQFCEEPILRGRYREQALIRNESPIPIMADESCCSMTDMQNLLDYGSCDMFNIKLGKTGGIYKAQQLLRKAEDHGYPVQLSGFLESRLGFTATAHLALTSEVVRYCDFDTPLMFSEDPVEGGIIYGGDWQVEIPETAGLGAGWIGKD